jgi:hypothetical protein
MSAQPTIVIRRATRRGRLDAVLLFVVDLMAEVRSAFPEVEAAGGQRVDVETLRS